MRHVLPFFFVIAGAIGCDPALDQDNESLLQEMAWSQDTVLPPSATNRYADDERAAMLGQRIFFDPAMSQDQKVACASCHVPEQGWSDDRAVSLGVDEAEGGRHSMPSHSIAFQDFFFWDGRADSAWSQTLQAIESEAEMDFARTQVAHYVAKYHQPEYELIFGSMPDLTDVPARAMPTQKSWEQMSEAQQDDVNRVFANVGKSLEAYQRRLTCDNTRFDQWARGEVEMTINEEQGAAVFMENGCVDCHSGVAFSDGEFHRLNVSSVSSADVGREDGLTSLFANPFNSVGVYSDDPAYGEAKLEAAMNESSTMLAYKTPSLRGVTQRGRFGHGGQHNDLQTFIEDTYRNGGGRRNTQRDPLLNGVNVGPWGDELVEFLGMLACPTIEGQWGAPSESSTGVQ